jgi:hypothetical protein
VQGDCSAGEHYWRPWPPVPIANALVAEHPSNCGTKNVQEEKSWETVVLEDFADLRKAGLTNPLMDEIEKQFTAAG